MIKLKQNLLLGLVASSLLACSSISVPNRPVIEPNTQVEVKTAISEIATPTPVLAKCPRGKKSYKCRHPKKAQGIAKSYKPTVATRAVSNSTYRFEPGSVVEVRELSSIANILTVKTIDLLQNQRGDLIISQGAVLKLICSNNTKVQLNEINNKRFSVPVVLQNKEHEPTGCDKTNGVIKYLQITRNAV